MRRSQQAIADVSLRLTRPRVLYTGNPRGPTLNGLMDWLGKEVGDDAEWHALGSGPGGSVPADAGTSAGPAAGAQGAWRTPADVVICVSAELAPKVCAAAVAGVQPRLLVVVVHRADTHTKNAKFLALHPQATRMMALAPHVANLSSHMLKRNVDWSMPVAPFEPAQPCRSKDCLQGFSIQGALRRYKSKHGNGFTRDYGALWARMLELRKQGVAVPPVVVVGKGERRHLMLPRELESSVTFHPWLKYQDFWMLIHRSYALVPAFGMPVYYESRISSTILASLITCVPVIAEQRLLDTYTFLSEEHVFLRQPDEDEAAAMARIAALPDQAIFAKREALCELRRQMDARVDRVLGGYIAEASKMR
ncbi:hypothetical protein HXX76_004289 [Chlamydomonas incerta]|uniref:Glycosyltransferase n=1 Tax=Chlamydomonas incerta TaxID=51695 RepID=A0A835T9X9_CHLIN|nr:hypothetical protein HXX76_004289 [Chlamydomonas incerta]|eukprot:KAG2440176.1 hypothetical protein HXX76_004289 [Chlamydomonas incerta]